MTEHGLPQVKCEPLSEEEDGDTYFSHHCVSNQHPLNEVSGVNIKLESVCHNQDNGHRKFLQHLHGSSTLEELSPLAPAGPAATPVCVKQEASDTPPTVTLETLESASHNAGGSTLISRRILLNSNEAPIAANFMSLMTVKDEPLSEGEQYQLSGEDTSDSCSTQPELVTRGSPKSWTQQDMENALDALRKHNMSLTKASATYGIPSTTLWQRAHRLGIDTPKKEGTAKSWSEADLRGALQALRAGAISANKASKAYGIPSSTLYKIARREGIRLSAPFNAAPTAWRRADLHLALASIRCGACSVQRAASQYGIPTGTLYGRCKREGIELSRANPTPWSENAMVEALEAVKVGQMSINQAAIHYNLPYSSLYGRFKRCKSQNQVIQTSQQQDPPKSQEVEHHIQATPYYQPTQAHHLHPQDHTHGQTYTQQYGHDMTSVQDYGQGFYNQNFSSIVSS